ncbi:alpha/beta hydrolase [Motiliproteus sp. SC1-56]|uniref:alpha/beta hydrolase n=1 Tax=Motiliproteus sp. SC1-56 TaxID=2799565 RepID=UPI001A8D53EC|nr:alpha/beta hydrolase [Motiliproteus sp. SC1-56]
MDYDPTPLATRLHAGASPEQLAEPGLAFSRYYGLDFPARLVRRRWLQGLTVGGVTIAVHHFLPHAPRGTVLLVHGYQDHHGLYGHLIEYALKRHLAVLCFDLPGHGLSAGPRASIDDFDRYQQVLQGVLAHRATLDWPGPLHLLGQSTGAAILCQHLLQQRPSPDGTVVLLAPLVRPAKWQLVQTAHRLLTPWTNGIPRTFTSNSHDVDFLRFLREQDPLQARIISAAWIGALRRWIPGFLALAPAPDYRPLIIQGREDGTVDWRYNLGVLQDKFPGCRICYLEQGRHHLANEAPEIRHEYLAWLQRHWTV